ncbi:MAG: hypothetical protein JWM00_713 [Candidatus Saccharibacteria bacterium]|nr:hypothetical protein [Candidatus Saccharibacteria bacterium]
MNNSRRLPSYIVPMEEIVLDKLRVIPAEPVIVNDDWQRNHRSGSIIIEEDGHNGLIDNWVYFHALLADSRLPVYALHAKGEEASSFQINEFDNEDNVNLVPRVINFDSEDLLPAVYLDYEEPPEVSYKKAYDAYIKQGNVYFSALKNYFVAQDINFNKRLRNIDNSYWQIVMLVSTLEALLPPPVFCKGKCETCGKGLSHVLNDPGKDWNELLFNKITDKKIRKQYRDVLDEARYKIRNDTVHNGLAPGNTFWKSPSLPDGVTEYTTTKSLEKYKTDRYSLESFIDQLKQVCRYLLLNQFIVCDIFPSLKGIEVHSFSATSTESNFTMNIEIN